MLGRSTRVAGSLAVALFAATAFLILSSHGSAEPAPSLAIDAITDGNSATSLGTVDTCAAVNVGDTFTVDVAVRDAANLSSWELTFVHNRRIVEIVEQDVRLFLTAQPGSNAVNATEPLPDGNGQHLLSLGDLSNAFESGSGVLARLTLKAIAAGISEASLPQIDVDRNGKMDWGPVLKTRGAFTGDVNGDRFFDGPVAGATIAVDRPCPALTPTPLASTGATPGPGSTPGGEDGAGGQGATSSGSGPAVAGSENPGTTGAGGAGQTPAVAGALEIPDPDAKGPSVPESVTNPPSGSSSGGVPFWALIIATIAIVGLGGLSFFAVRARSDRSY